MAWIIPVAIGAIVLSGLGWIVFIIISLLILWVYTRAPAKDKKTDPPPLTAAELAAKKIKDDAAAELAAKKIKDDAAAELAAKKIKDDAAAELAKKPAAEEGTAKKPAEGTSAYITTLGIGYNNLDININGLTGTLEECKSECNKDTICKGFTIDKTSATSAINKCWFKNDFMMNYKFGEYDSYIKKVIPITTYKYDTKNLTDYHGNDITSYGVSIEDCKSLCDNDNKCKGFTKDTIDTGKNKGMCWLKHTMDNGKEAAARESYIKGASM